MLCLGLICVISGCFPLGSSMSEEKVLAEKKLPDGSVEKILFQKWNRYFLFIVGPEGFFRKANFWDYRYVCSSGSKISKLPFLQPEQSNLLQILQGPVAVPDSNRWVGTYYFEMEKNNVTLEVLLFTPEKLIARYTIKKVLRYRQDNSIGGYGVGVLMDDGKIFFPTSDGNYLLDGKTGKLHSPERQKFVSEY